MKGFKKLMAILMVSTLFMSTLTITALADNYTPVAGGTTSFNKYLIVQDGSDVPNKTFNFSIAAGTAIPATSTTMAVLAGPTTANAPTVGTATFTSSDTILTDSDGTKTKVNGAKYAVASGITVDFTGVTFDEPGVYRYVITEAAQSAPYTIESQNPLTLDVYVTDDGTGLAVSSYVLHEGTAAPAKGANNGSGDVKTADAAVADKTDGFVNSYDTKDIEVSKTVTGNQASKDKYFQFTVTVTGATAADTFNVDITDADASPAGNSATTYSSMTNPAEVTGAQLASGVNFYLQDGQSVKVLGLPAGATYTITEVAEDYKPSLTLTGDNDATTTDTSATGTLDDTVSAAFTNTREGVIPTGVLLTIAPFAIGLLLFGALGIFTISKRRREAF